jgi:deazaflavin-dependent oxidoreductase (nitroreductase family)
VINVIWRIPVAKQYHLTRPRRVANALMKARLRLGLKPGTNYLLTVRGHKSGKLYTTPVTLVEEDGKRWLVAPYGEVSWVHNARTAGEVTLQQGRSKETIQIRELGPEESGPVLKRYIQAVPITRPYVDADPDAPVDEFVKIASRHPVFRLDTSPRTQE